jgi:hypothetical protein
MAGQGEAIMLTIGDVEHTLPTKFVVCDRCEGRGKHVNPNIDGNGISAEQFAEDPDFKESYFRGDYDVQCERCNGLRVVPVVDEARCKPKLLKAYKKQQQEEAQYQAECRMERRAEAWASGERDFF